MGMDLLLWGFTTKQPSADYSKEKFVNAIKALTDEWLDESAEWIDYSGATDTADELRDRLVEGAELFDLVVYEGYRMAASYNLPGTSFEFHVTGGGSWGDDPYDGWTSLGMLTELLAFDDDLSVLCGFVCGGLPLIPTP